MKNDVEYRQQLAMRVSKIAGTIEDGGPKSSGGRVRSAGGGAAGSGGGAQGSSDGLKKAKSSSKELGTEQVMSGYTQTVKAAVFSAP